MGPRELLHTVGAPAAVAAAALLVGLVPRPRGSAGHARVAIASAFAVAAGIIVAQLLLHGWRAPWPPDATGRLSLIAAAAFTAEAVCAAARRPILTIPVRGAVVALLLVALAAPYLGDAPMLARAALWFPGLGLAVLAWWSLIDHAAARTRGACVPLVLWLGASAAALLLTFSYHAALGLCAASIAATFGPMVLLAWWRPGTSARGAAGVAAVMLASLLLLVGITGAVKPWMIALVAAAPLTALGRGAPLMARLRPGVATLACVFVAAGFAVMPVGVAWRAYSLE